VSIDVQKFDGGKGWMTKALGLGVAGLALAAVGGVMSKREALFGYLVSFTYWAGIALASLIMLMIFHAFRAKWMVVLRRPLEAMATTILLFLPLCIPILLGMSDLYSWVHPDHNALSHEAAEMLEHKAGYLNVPFFVGRTVGYLLLASFLAWRLFGLSTRQDGSGDPGLTQKQRNVGVAGLPFMALVITFAAFDWLMSLNPLWFSTIFGVYYFAGSFWSTVAILIIATSLARGRGLFGEHVTIEHLHNLGKLLFAFTCFWGYIAFSQMMLIWIANLPEEIGFFTVRMKGDWAGWGIFLILGHFLVPFGLLLSRELKRTPGRLSLVAGWALLMNLVDIFWLVMPTLDEKAVPLTPSVLLGLVGSFVGVGGLAVAFAIWRIRGHFTVPVKDPFLPVSLRYRQPT
jgi:hypothetical protein